MFGQERINKKKERNPRAQVLPVFCVPGNRTPSPDDQDVILHHFATIDIIQPTSERTNRTEQRPSVGQRGSLQTLRSLPLPRLPGVAMPGDNDYRRREDTYITKPLAVCRFLGVCASGRKLRLPIGPDAREQTFAN